MTSKELADNLRAELDEHLQALRKIADMIEAMDRPPPEGDLRQAWLSFPFNMRPIKVTGEFGVMYTIGGKTWQHEGMDFSLPVGISVFASAEGQVVIAGPRSGYGNCVRIEHLHNGEKWWTWYAHLSQVTVMVGGIVTTGFKIGLSGNTGNTTGSHLHLTVQRASSDYKPDGCGEILRGVVNPRLFLQWPEE